MAGNVPPPVLVDGSEEFEIERILSHQATRRGLRFVVRWRGFGAEEDSAVMESDMGHARELVEAYKRSKGLG